MIELDLRFDLLKSEEDKWYSKCSVTRDGAEYCCSYYWRHQTPPDQVWKAITHHLKQNKILSGKLQQSVQYVAIQSGLCLITLLVADYSGTCKLTSYTLCLVKLSYFDLFKVFPKNLFWVSADQRDLLSVMETGKNIGGWLLYCISPHNTYHCSAPHNGTQHLPVW